MDWPDPGFGLYLHWPFCQAKCPYCDFNSHVAQAVNQARWTRAFTAEIARAAQETGPRLLQSVFFGGGTPSLMTPETVDAILTAVRAAWPMANDIEITLEANPTSVEAGRFAGYAAAGVNRVSMGVQALDDADLRALGRLHDVAQARAAFDIARRQFERVSFDLIYARQHQTAADWRAELRRALDMAVDHLSLYQLTIEDGTAFGQRHAAGKLPGLPDEDRAADMWDITQEETAAAGMPAYEISNHARAGAQSRHNLVYWRSGDYVGIGPGAHGRLARAGGRIATVAEYRPEDWLRMVELGRTGEVERQDLTGQDRLTEFVLMGLRLSEGIPLARLEQLGGDRLPRQDLIAEGFLEIVAGHLRATAMGRPVLNALLRRLLADTPQISGHDTDLYQ